MASLSEKCIHRFILPILFHMMSGHRSVVGFFLVCKQRRNSSLSRRSTCNESVLKKSWLGYLGRRGPQIDLKTTQLERAVSDTSACGRRQNVVSPSIRDSRKYLCDAPSHKFFSPRDIRSSSTAEGVK